MQLSAIVFYPKEWVRLFFCTFEEKLKAKKTQVFPNFRKTQVKKVPKSGFFASLYYISFQKTQEKNSENSIFRDFQFFQIRLGVKKKPEKNAISGFFFGRPSEYSLISNWSKPWVFCLWTWVFLEVYSGVLFGHFYDYGQLSYLARNLSFSENTWVFLEPY